MSILQFIGEFDFLSNFYPAEFVWDDIIWPTSEHAYQASKTLNKQKRFEISKLVSPGKSKREGQKLELRKDWNKIKLMVMYEIVKQKFIQNKNLKDKLLLTEGEYLEEGNNHGDNFWGCCPPGSTNGSNHLGIVLMNIRNEFKLEEFMI